MGSVAGSKALPPSFLLSLAASVSTHTLLLLLPLQLVLPPHFPRCSLGPTTTTAARHSLSQPPVSSRHCCCRQHTDPTLPKRPHTHTHDPRLDPPVSQSSTTERPSWFRPKVAGRTQEPLPPSPPTASGWTEATDSSWPKYRMAACLSSSRWLAGPWLAGC